jgi:hypothetical protein
VKCSGHNPWQARGEEQRGFFPDNPVSTTLD